MKSMRLLLKYPLLRLRKPSEKISLFAHQIRFFSSSALTHEERRAALSALQKSPFAWKEKTDRDAIQKSFEFTDFNQAFSFISRCALLAEK